MHSNQPPTLLQQNLNSFVFLCLRCVRTCFLWMLNNASKKRLSTHFHCPFTWQKFWLWQFLCAVAWWQMWPVLGRGAKMISFGYALFHMFPSRLLVLDSRCWDSISCYTVVRRSRFREVPFVSIPVSLTSLTVSIEKSNRSFLAKRV